MSYDFSFRDQTLFELAEAYVWYEKKRLGLGKDIRKEVSDKINKIANDPYLYKKTSRDQHEALVARFPFLLFILSTSKITIY